MYGAANEASAAPKLFRPSHQDSYHPGSLSLSKARVVVQSPALLELLAAVVAVVGVKAAQGADGGEPAHHLLGHAGGKVGHGAGGPHGVVGGDGVVLVGTPVGRRDPDALEAHDGIVHHVGVEGAPAPAPGAAAVGTGRRPLPGGGGEGEEAADEGPGSVRGHGGRGSGEGGHLVRQGGGVEAIRGGGGGAGAGGRSGLELGLDPSPLGLLLGEGGAGRCDQLRGVAGGEA